MTTDIGAQGTVRSKAGPTTAVTITVPAGRSGPTIDAIEVGVGTVALFDARGDTRIRTGIGDVIATGVDGYLNVHTQIGTVLLSDVSGLDGVRTEVGDIKVGLLDLRGDVVIGTDIGSVTVGVADDLDLDVLAETGGGFDANLPLTDERARFGQFTGRQNAGGHRLQLSSELGAVSLRSIGRDERGVTAS